MLFSRGDIVRPHGTSIDILEDVKNGKNSTSCYGYAVVLNDVLCALGYKCKYIFCKPIALHFIDCHVVNLVYSNDLHKWVILDVAQSVYYTDEFGCMLSLEELMNKIIDNRTINLNLLESYDNLTDLQKNT